MKETILSIGVALALATSVYGAEQKKFTCRITGKTVDKCCCEMKAGKFYCK